MSNPLIALEQQRAVIVSGIADLGDFPQRFYQRH